MKVSKKLSNTIVIDVNKEEERLFKINLEKLGIKIINVSFPERIENISKSFIEKNWKNVAKTDIKNVIMVGNTKGKIIVIFENEEYQFDILKLVEKLKLDAVYTYTIDLGEKIILQKEWYSNGVCVRDNYDEEEEKIKSNKFTIVRCLK